MPPILVHGQNSLHPKMLWSEFLLQHNWTGANFCSGTIVLEQKIGNSIFPVEQNSLLTEKGEVLPAEVGFDIIFAPAQLDWSEFLLQHNWAGANFCSSTTGVERIFAPVQFLLFLGAPLGRPLGRSLGRSFGRVSERNHRRREGWRLSR